MLLGTVNRVWPVRVPVGDCHLEPSLVMATNGNHLNVALAKQKSSSLPNYTRRTGLSLFRDVGGGGGSGGGGARASSGSSTASFSDDDSLAAPIKGSSPIKIIRPGTNNHKGSKEFGRGNVSVIKCDWMLDVPRSLCQKSRSSSSSLRGSLDSLSAANRKERRQAMKVRAEARRDQYREKKSLSSSSSEEDRLVVDWAKDRWRSDDALSANSSREKKLRVARTERYYKRRSRDDESLRRNGTGNSTPESEDRSNKKKSLSPCLRPSALNLTPTRNQALEMPFPAISPRIHQSPRYVLQDGVLKCLLSPGGHAANAPCADPTFVFPVPDANVRQSRAPTPPPRTSAASQPQQQQQQQQVIRRGSVQGRWPPVAHQHVPLQFTSTSTVYTVSAVGVDKPQVPSSMARPLNHWQPPSNKENINCTTSAPNASSALTSTSSSLGSSSSCNTNRNFNSVPKPWSLKTCCTEDNSRQVPPRRPTPSPEASSPPTSSVKPADNAANQVYIFRLKPTNGVDPKLKSISLPKTSRNSKALSLVMGCNDNARKSPVGTPNSPALGASGLASPTMAPPPPVRKHFRQSLPVNPEDMEHVLRAIESHPPTKTRNQMVNYEDALDELDKLFHSLKFSEDDTCKKTETAAEKVVEGNRKKQSPGSRLQLSNEPDVVLDDLAYRSIRDANKSLRVQEPQPLFGIPLRPLSRSSSGDYLNENVQEAPRPVFQRRFTPDVFGDDLAYRNLRRESKKQQQKLNFEELDAILDTSKAFFASDAMRNRRAVRSLSANIGQSKELTVANVDTSKVGYNMDKSQSMNDLTSTSPFLRKTLGRKAERGRRNSADMSKCNNGALPPWKGNKDHSVSNRLSGLVRSGSGSSTETLTENTATTPCEARIVKPILKPTPVKADSEANEVWQVRVTLGTLDSAKTPARIKDGRQESSKDLPRPVPLRPTNTPDKVGSGKVPLEDTGIRRNSVAPIDEDRLDAMLSSLAEGVAVTHGPKHTTPRSNSCHRQNSTSYKGHNHKATSEMSFPSVVTDEATGEMSVVLPLPGLSLQESSQSRKITLTRTGGDHVRNRPSASALDSPPTRHRTNDRGFNAINISSPSPSSGHDNITGVAEHQHHHHPERSSVSSPSFRNSVSPALHSLSSSSSQKISGGGNVSPCPALSGKPPDGAAERIARYKEERRKQLAASYGERISSPEEQNLRRLPPQDDKGNGCVATSPTKKIPDAQEVQNGKTRSSFRRYIARESPSPENHDASDNFVRSTRASRLRAMANNTVPTGEEFSRQGSFRSKVAASEDGKEQQSVSSSSEVTRAEGVGNDTEDGLRGSGGSGCSTRPKDKSSKRKSSLNRLGAIEGTLGRNDSADEAPARPQWRRHSGSGNSNGNGNGNGTAGATPPDGLKSVEVVRVVRHQLRTQGNSAPASSQSERSILAEANDNDTEACRRKALPKKPQIPEIFRQRNGRSEQQPLETNNCSVAVKPDFERTERNEYPECESRQRQRVRNLTEHVRELTQLAKQTAAQVDSLTATATGAMGNRWSGKSGNGASTNHNSPRAVTTTTTTTTAAVEDSGVDSYSTSESLHVTRAQPNDKEEGTKVFLSNSHFELDSSQVPAVGKAYCAISVEEGSPVRIRHAAKSEESSRRHGVLDDRSSGGQSLAASVFGELKKKGIRFSEDGNSSAVTETVPLEDPDCSGDDSGGRSRPSILKKRSLEEVNDDHGVRSILKNKDESSRVEGRPPVAPPPQSILRKGSSEDLPRGRSRSPDRASILKKRNSSSEESTGRRSSSPELGSILRRKSADEAHSGSILRRRVGTEDCCSTTNPSPPPHAPATSLSRSANGSPETTSLHSILKRRFSSEWSDAVEHPRPILKKGSAEELMDSEACQLASPSCSSLLDPKPILKKRNSAEEDLDPRPILRSRRTSREDDAGRLSPSPQACHNFECGAFLRARISWGEQEPPEMEIKHILKTPPRSPNRRLIRADSPRPRSPPLVAAAEPFSAWSSSDEETEFLSLPSSPAFSAAAKEGGSSEQHSPGKEAEKSFLGEDTCSSVAANSAMDSETSSSSSSSTGSSSETEEEEEDDDDEGVLFSVDRIKGQGQESQQTKRQGPAESSSSKDDCSGSVSSEKVSKRLNFIRRRAECGTERYRTQPVTSGEIDNLSGLESVRSFRSVVLSKAPGDMFVRRGSAPVTSPTSPKSPTDKKSKMAEFPQPFQPNVRRDRSRYRTLPITFEELADAEKTEPIRNIRKSGSLASPKEEDEEKEDDDDCGGRGDEAIIHLSVAAKASLFMQKHEELSRRRLPGDRKPPRFSDRGRRNLQRSQTQPITVEEVTEAAKIAEKSAAERRSPGKEDRQSNTGTAVTKEDADSDPDPSLLSLAERVKLFNRKMLEERLPTKKPDFEPPPQGPVRRSRTMGVVSTRFRTQPITWEEVEMAANLAKPVQSRTAFIAPLKDTCCRPKGILKNSEGKGRDDDPATPARDVSKVPESKGRGTLKASSTSSSSSSSSSEDEDQQPDAGGDGKLGGSKCAMLDEDSSSSSSATKKIKNEAVSRRRNAAIRKMEERRSLSEYHTSSRQESVTSVSRSASLTVVHGTEQSLEVLEKRRMQTVAHHRSSTEPLSLGLENDSKEEVRVSIKDRLAALQRSGTEDWKKRLGKLKPDHPETEIKAVLEPEQESQTVADVEKQMPSISSNGDRLIANRLNQLHVRSEDWKKRIEEKDATKFTVAGKMGQVDKVMHPNDSPLTDRERRTPKATRFKSKTSHCLSKSPSASPIASLASIMNSAPRGLPPICRSKTMPSSAMSAGLGSSSEEDKSPVKVRVPRPDEGLSEFFTSVTMESLNAQKLDVTQCVFEEVVSNSSSQMLRVHRRNVVMHRRRLGARNPLRKLASRSDIQDEYTEVFHGYAEQELKRKKIEQIAKTTDLAISAIAGLASKEDFKAVSLKRSPSMSGSSLLPHKDLMLLQVKGRRHVQTRLVEPVLTSLNNGDNFILVTPNNVFHWIGKYSNVIERAKAAEVAAVIQTKKDLCYAGPSELVTFDEEKPTVNRARRRDFFEKLGGEDAIAPAGDVNEDELYEAIILDTNKMYYVEGDELVPYEQYWGCLPRIEMLEPSKVLVFDFGSEMYVWHGKLALAEDRKVGMHLAQELWDEGYDYSDCDINPLSPTCLLQPSTSKRGEKRPSWALLAKLNQHMETVLFREKFLDWPDLERVIRVKRQDSESKSDVSPELVPYDAEVMLKTVADDPDLILEGSHIGRGVRFWDEAEKKQYEIVTKDVKTWHVLESGPRILPLESRGQFHSGNTYVIRWHYLVTIGGRSLAGQLSKHVTGRERCAYFFWQGRDSTINEKGACALMTIELNEERGPHIRVVQGHEPPCFLNLFDGRAIVHLGKREGEENNEGSWRLFVVQGVYENEAILLETKRSANALRSRGCLLLVNVEKGRVYIWKGCKAPPHVIEVAIAAADNLQERRPQDMRFGYGVQVTARQENEGAESAEFWEGLGGGNLNMYYSLLSSKDSFRYSARLFHLSSVSGTFEATEVLCPFRSKERDCPFPFSQSDLYKETQPALFMLDNEHEVYLWQGWWPEAVDDNDNTATGSAKVRWNVDRRLAMDTVVAYCKAKLSDRGTLVTPFTVSAGLEPMEFINLFPEWSNHDDVAERNMKDGKKPGEKVAVSSVLAKLKRTRYKLSELLEKPLPDGVDPMRVESYLSDDDFLEVMKMPKREFYNLPEWKQSQVKKPTGLY